MKVGFSGANFAIAETGGCLRRRIGRQRPHVRHAAGRADHPARHRENDPSFRDLEVFLQLLPRSATGERMNPYNSIWTGVTAGDGPREFHVVLLDNGRTNVLADRGVARDPATAFAAAPA